MARSPQAVLAFLSIVLVSVAVEKVAQKTLRRRKKSKKQALAAEPAADAHCPVPGVSVEDKPGMNINTALVVDAVCADDSSEEAAACSNVAPGPSGQMGWHVQVHLLLLNALAAFQHLVIFFVSFTVFYIFWPFSSASLMGLFLAGPIVLDLHSTYSRFLDNALSKPIRDTPVTAWHQSCI